MSEEVCALDCTHLRIDRVCAGYGQMEVLHGVSLRVESGELVAIIGPNGCGKSTLLKTVCGLLRPREGTISLRRRNITFLSPRARLRAGVGYVPQSRNVFSNMTVSENLRMGALLSRKGSENHMNRVYALFPTLEAQHNRIVGLLSGGQQQMVALGRALMSEPSLLLLDEPTAGLAPKVVNELFECVRQITQAGLSVLIVEQNAIKALSMADRAYVLANGENQLEGRASDILEDPAIRRLYLGHAM
ncbi:MAG: ABC transporter ATP-binding protein [Gammaproteobacteria bacterium]|nr:ABC transporter ATP-binding protein [Gammaproteobacteria bacterium]NIR88861.1 ABC transporter ATP-binding protein [Gammaproteobacteria bacterium]NIU06465.1 ABC transporter ATP-binding protein [Gammaproteobacteria bacterium]NIV53357.1 ATP-binding cassette domain-containing protein [Gammaproteobacteria bacterium]NIV74076.1 ATP-binding cassette domain-containing protein [Gammaproteobacteria bacterium]